MLTHILHAAFSLLMAVIPQPMGTDNVASVDAARSRRSNGQVVRLYITFRTE